MGVGIDILHPHPDAELTQCAGEVIEIGFIFLAAPCAGLITNIETISRCVLANHDKLFNAALDELLGITHDFGDIHGIELPAQVRNDAEGTFIVAAL